MKAVNWELIWQQKIDDLQRKGRLVPPVSLGYTPDRIVYTSPDGFVLYRLSLEAWTNNVAAEIMGLRGPALTECVARVARHLAGGNRKDHATRALAIAAGLRDEIDPPRADAQEVLWLLFGGPHEAAK